MISLLLIRIVLSLIPYIHYVLTQNTFNYIYLKDDSKRRRYVPEKEA